MFTKKILAFAVVVAMMFGCFVPVFAMNVAPDVTGTEYQDLAAVLGALEIMVGDSETGNFRPEDDILRSEAATVAIRELGLENIAKSQSGTPKYPDVHEGHWATGYINVATSQGIVVGDTAGTFRPDDVITINEAAVIFTKMLGYETRAESSGSFPTGYMIVAQDLGLFRNIPASELNGNAKRGIIAKMAENALEVKLMEQNGDKYEVTEKTILFDKLGVTKAYDQVVATCSQD